MPSNVIMPALGMAQEKGRLVRWVIAEGESVAKGAPLMEVETDKAVVEIESPASGVLANVTARPGDEVPVGHVVAVVLAPGESMPPGAPAGAKGGSGVSRAAHATAQAPSGPAGPPGALQEAGRRPMSPRARRLAAERGIDASSIAGTGDGGAVRAADILAAPAPTTHAAQTPDEEQPLEVSHVWRVMAERMVASWTAVPHFYLSREADAAALVRARGLVAQAVEQRAGVKPTYTDLLVRIVALALRAHPRVNATVGGGSIRVRQDINISLAMATPAGLVAPVVRKADQIPMAEITARRQDLAERAEAGKLRQDDMSGGTFTISNLGMYGVDAFNAIVNAPQAALLAIGRIADRVVAVDGKPQVRPRMALTLSCDHRALDGAIGARFLAAVVRLVENPEEACRDSL